jgi:hypothetical protein
MQSANQESRGRCLSRRRVERLRAPVPIPGVVARCRPGARALAASATGLTVAVLGLYGGLPAVATSGHSTPGTVEGSATMPGPNVLSGLRPAIEGPGPNLYSVAAIASDDAWTVGLAHGLVLSEHWDGDAWSLGHTGIPGGSLSSGLYGVSADASDDVWAVGSFSSQATKRSSLAAHWDGTDWTLMHTDDPVGGLYAVDAISPANVWAVGSYADEAGTVHPAIEHWNGSRWANVDGPRLDSGSLGSLTAVSSSDVWAAGSYTDASGTQLPVTEHWDGSSWTLVKAVVPRSAVFTSLLGISAVASDDVWAVGAYLNSDLVLKTLTEHWDGTRWKLVGSPNIQDGWSELTAVTAVGPDDVWAVGNVLPNAGGGTTYTLHWDGSKWRHVDSPSLKDRTSILVAASAVDTDDIWAVGYGVSNSDPYDVRNLIEHWNGSRWKLVKNPDA